MWPWRLFDMVGLMRDSPDEILPVPTDGFETVGSACFGYFAQLGSEANGMVGFDV